MQDTPKALRRHIAVMGRRNAGKSSLVNALTGQSVSIVSSVPGTTTDPVEKTLELQPLGPVVLIDTAGIDDVGELGASRNERSLKILVRSDLAIIVTNGDDWGEPETGILKRLDDLPCLIVRNKADLGLAPASDWRKQHNLPENIPIVDIAARQAINTDAVIVALSALAGTVDSRPLLADLLPEHGLALLVVLIDSGAPQGRLILPQVQAIRDCLDAEKCCLVTTPAQMPQILERIRPDLVVCDSQVAKLAADATPAAIPFTTFSILMARARGNLQKFAAGTQALTQLKPGDKVLIQEACSHHAQKDDIGTVKIPRFLRQLAGGDLIITHARGKEPTDYEPDLKAIVHCGGCVITPRQMAVRQKYAEQCHIPMTNYGMTITLAQGLLNRALRPLIN